MGSQNSTIDETYGNSSTVIPKKSFANESNKLLDVDKNSNSQCSDSVNVEFRWIYEGEDIYQTGNFTDWKNHIKMEKIYDEFKYILKLPKGIYYYKFIVDGEWKFSPDDPHTPDENGNINNYIDTTQIEKNVFIDDPEPIENQKPMQLVETKKTMNTDFKFDDEAPPLPLHFQTILFLNKHEHKLKSFKKYKQNEQKKHEAAYLIKILDQPLPPPTHAELNHLGTKESPKDVKVSVVTTTSRYKAKYCTYKQYTRKS